jgi:hypothetical protein
MDGTSVSDCGPAAIFDGRPPVGLWRARNLRYPFVAFVPVRTVSSGGR